MKDTSIDHHISYQDPYRQMARERVTVLLDDWDGRVPG